MVLDEIIERLGAALDQPEMSKKALAKLLGVSTQAMRNWRRGENFPNKNRWLKIESVTGVSLDWIFLKDETSRAQSQLEAQLLLFYRGMSAEKQATLLTIANTFYNETHPGPSKGDPFPKPNGNQDSKVVLIYKPKRA